MISRPKAVALASVGILLVSMLTGCASPATKEAMTVSTISVAKNHNHTVSVIAQGGKQTGAADLPSIANRDFKAAITKSILENGLFTAVMTGSSADYQLSVTIVNMSTPGFGASMTASMEGAWSLQNLATKEVVMRRSFDSTYTAGAFDAFAGVTRSRFAVEGAARENIKLGLVAISELELD